MATFAFTHFAWLPRIMRRRLAAEWRSDPVRAAAEQRTRRRQARLGFALGTLFGGGAVLASWCF